MPGEQISLNVVRPDATRAPVVLRVSDDSPDNPSWTRLELRYEGHNFVARGRQIFFVLRDLRTLLEAQGLLLECYGASRNVWPSGMSLSMGGGGMAYKMFLGRYARTEDLVDILNTGPDVEPASVRVQEEFVLMWRASLRKRSESDPR